MKDYSDQLCAKYGLHITEKGKTFDGQEREETVAFSKGHLSVCSKKGRAERDKELCARYCAGDIGLPRTGHQPYRLCAAYE